MNMKLLQALNADWMEGLNETVKFTVDGLVWLILGSHYLHTRNLKVADFGKQCGLKIIYLPKCYMRKLQCFNVTPLKKYY
jgi:hypothetical protein